MYIRDSKQRKCQLKQISSNDLLAYRLSKKTGFVLKINDQLFLTKPTRNTTISLTSFGNGLCATCDNACKECPKAKDLTLPILLKFGYSFFDSVHKYGRPEKYDFITFAVEVFDRKNSNCVVCECSNYCKRNPSDYEQQYFCETI